MALPNMIFQNPSDVPKIELREGQSMFDYLIEKVKALEQATTGRRIYNNRITLTMEQYEGMIEFEKTLGNHNFDAYSLFNKYLNYKKRMRPQKFTKKPVTIEAIQFDGSLESAQAIQRWAKENLADIRFYASFNVAPSSLDVHTQEGVMQAQPNDWIIKGVNGEFYPCKPDIFEKTYSVASDLFGIGLAVQNLEEGKRVARQGWNGKGAWLTLTEGKSLKTSELWSKANKDFFSAQDAEEVNIGAYVSMYTAQGILQPGWLCSQADLLAKDWMVCE
jgi:hypothetical protein